MKFILYYLGTIFGVVLGTFVNDWTYTGLLTSMALVMIALELIIDVWYAKCVNPVEGEKK